MRPRVSRLARRTLAVGVALVTTLALAPAARAAGSEPDWRTVRNTPVTGVHRDVVAVSAHDAWAVGRERTTKGSSTLVERWDGQKWRRVSVPGADRGWLTGVDAASSDNVWAVGTTHGKGPKFLHWDGRQWSTVPPASPPGNEHPGSDDLKDVAAVSGNDAWAVGLHWPSGSNPTTLIEHWDGQKWSRVPSPNPGTRGQSLEAVSAVSATDVWAVGYKNTGLEKKSRAIALHWDGQKWRTTPMELPRGNSQLFAVNAVSSDNVWAVGARDGEPFTMHWDGSRWRMLPRAPAKTNVRLRAVTPDGRGGVWVAGTAWSSNKAGVSPAYFHWDGDTWTKGTSQAPEGRVYGLAVASSGPGGTSTWAAGTKAWCQCQLAPTLIAVNGETPR